MDWWGWLLVGLGSGLQIGAMIKEAEYRRERREESERRMEALRERLENKEEQP